MKISEVCIERPVFAWVLTLIIILIGIVSAYRLPLQQYPNIERHYITIETSLPGAGPEVVENQISRIIEEIVSGIEGIESLHSTSSVEESKVSIEFKPERNMDNAANDIRDRLSKNRNRLPDDAEEPIIIKTKADEKPIITLALTSENLETSKLADYAEVELRKDLESLSGVARVDVIGAGKYIMNISLNPSKLVANSITVTDVINALKRQNVEQPAGKIISKDREYLVTTVASLEQAEEFENIAIVTKKNHIIRLRDIGYAEIKADDKKTKTLYNGKQGVSISIIKQSNTNPIEVARGVKNSLKSIQKTLPEGMEIHVGSDKTSFIEQSLSEVYKTIFEATILVIFVVFLFLKSARASIIPLVTIPVSLIGTMFIMYLLNFSLNTFTLMAMVLAIGLVVDDAIVILENIYRYIEKGNNPFKASFNGVREISFAVIAMTLTLAAVYAPISLAKGITGKILTEFSITLATSVIISGFAALTLSPMMCARMLGEGKEYFKFWTKFKDLIDTEKWLMKTEHEYEKALNISMKKRLNIVVSAIVFACIGFFVSTKLASEFWPNEDQNSFFIEGRAPQTSTLGYTEKYVTQLDNIVSNIPEAKQRIVQIINPSYDMSVQLNPDKKRSTDSIVNELKKTFDSITGIEAHASSSSGGGAADSKSVEFVVRGNKSYRELKGIARAVSADLYSSGKVQNIMSSSKDDTQDFTISILRDKVSSLNVEPKTIADTIDALIRGRKAGTFKKDNKVYDVNVEIESSARTNPHDITNLFVKSGNDRENNTQVPLAELVNVNSRSGPVEIFRYNRMRAISISAKLKPSCSLGEGVELVQEIAKDVVHSDARYEFIQETKRYLTESYTMQLIFFLAIAFIYLVMAAQFESWRDPFVILLSVPLSLTGAVLTLALIDKGSLNLYSNIGMITLVGLITKHGIMIVDFANKLRDEGAEMVSAVVKASTRRLRPILMTTFAMVLGALPLAFATGAGSESLRQLGWVIVGGMVIGTIFTLFVIPVIYTYLSSKKRKRVSFEASN